MCEKHHAACVLCKTGGSQVSMQEAKKMIREKIGPTIASEKKMTQETGLSSFVDALASSGTTLQNQLQTLGLSCFEPVFW